MKLPTFICSALAVAGCGADPLPPLTGTQGLQVTIMAPTDLGSESTRLDENARTVSLDITAIGVDGEIDDTFDNDVQIYVQFLGTLTPYLCDPAAPLCEPLATAHMTGGHVTAPVSVDLPPVFGPTTIWVDDGIQAAPKVPTSATGASQTLWYRDPFIEDVQRPTDETALDALSRSPLVDLKGNGKQLSIDQSRYGAKGRLVVSSVFAQGYTLADVQCADEQGTPPCTSQDYDYVEVFSFSAAKDQIGCFLVEGQVIHGFNGGVADFNGLTEIGFPQTFVDHGTNGDCTVVDVDRAREPAPVKFDPAWFGSDPSTGKINFERNEAGAIEIDNATVCPLDDDYETFNQWKIDPVGGGDGCTGKDVINIITAGVIQGLDTAKLTSLNGQAIPKVVGMLRPINIGTFNVWLLFPRSEADVVLP